MFSCYLEKLATVNSHAHQLLTRLRTLLDIQTLDSVRVLQVYELDQIPYPAWLELAHHGLADKATDLLHFEKAPLAQAPAFSLAIGALPGQFDVRAQSALECLWMRMPSLAGQGQCRSTQIYLFEGQLSAGEMAQIEAYLLNPTDSQARALQITPPGLSLSPLPFTPKAAEAFESQSWPFVCEKKSKHFEKGFEQSGLGMSLADLQCARTYFQGLGRAPSELEMRLLDAYWSDHCRHSTFHTQLQLSLPKGENEALQSAFKAYETIRSDLGRTREPMSLMEMGTCVAKWMHKQGKLEDVELSEENNAASLKVEAEFDAELETGLDLKLGNIKRPYLVMFKNETHNHPTEIEPFGGASTCLGGAIRDPLSGRAPVYQALRISGSGDLYAKANPGKLAGHAISLGACEGYASYGNQIGVPTSLIKEYYHTGYEAKRLEAGFVVGAAPADHIKRETPKQGDVVLLIGGATGRDGVGGAVGSSQTKQSSKEKAACEVQKGHASEERKLQKLFRNPHASLLIKKANDFGAGGACVAVGELAAGIHLFLDKLPVKYEGLSPIELALSESQERMAVVVSKENMAKLIELAKGENLTATWIADITDTNQLTISYQDQIYAQLDRAFLDSGGAALKAKAKLENLAQTPLNRNWRDPWGLSNKKPSSKAFSSSFSTSDADPDSPYDSLAKLQQAVFSNPNSSLGRGLASYFDSTVGGTTVLMPYGGTMALSPTQASIHTLPPLKGQAYSTSVATFGFSPYQSEHCPFTGAVLAVVQALGKQVAAGANWRTTRLSFQEYFEKMEGEKAWGKACSALLGALWAQMSFQTPAIGGKDSMSGSYEDRHVPPSLIAFGLSISHLERARAQSFQAPRERIYLWLPHDLEKSDAKSEAPVLNDQTLTRIGEHYDQVQAWLQSGKLVAASVLEEGGALTTLAKMGLGQGLTLNWDKRWDERLNSPSKATQALLTQEHLGGMILSFAPEQTPDLPQGFIYLGQTCFDLETTKANYQALSSYQAPLYQDATALDSMPLSEDAFQKLPGKIQPTQSKAVSARAASPNVLLPVFSGTNSEIETEVHYHHAGARTTSLVFQTQSQAAIWESLEAFAKALDQTQILHLSGGFSASDEPDGSGKYISAVLLSPKVQEAIERLLDRGGLILGVCNGFQALIRSGLLPHGTPCTRKMVDPVLAANTLGHHLNQIAYIRQASAKSPWLLQGQIGEITATAASHGEGRFVCNESTYQSLVQHHQIAFEYCDLSGQTNPSQAFNPNGSSYHIEGLLARNGQILGKMGHFERQMFDSNGKPLLLQNVPFGFQNHLLRSGVGFFV